MRAASPTRSPSRTTCSTTRALQLHGHGQCLPTAMSPARRRFRALSATSRSSSTSCWPRHAISRPTCSRPAITSSAAMVPAGPELLRALDADRDQSYFLFATTRAQLAHLWFPLGGLRKAEVRALARRFALPVADKPDSQDICFVPQGRYTDVVERLKPGAARRRRHRPRRRPRARPPRGHHQLHHRPAPGPGHRRWRTALRRAPRCRPQRGGRWTARLLAHCGDHP